MTRFNDWLAAKITSAVSTMWAAYVFALIALVSLPTVIRTGDPVIIVAWVAQTFLQLVLLAVIMVGQNQASRAVDQKIDETHTAALAEFEMAKEERAAQAAEVASQAEQMAALVDLNTDIHALLTALKVPEPTPKTRAKKAP